MLARGARRMGLWAVLVLHQLLFLNQSGFQVKGETLTPPYFNLAEGRKITASATCGVDTEGPELYCKLIGANSENDKDVKLIQGQLCDECDPTNPSKMHPPEFAVDGMETWWQSPPLSRGMKYNEVNLTIDLGQEFHVAYVFIRMGNSPRPGLWVLEKSADYGKTFTPWQYFSDMPDDCRTFFGVDSMQPIDRDDTVICTTEYSKIVPLEGGEIPISLLNNRPSANHYFNSTILQEWTRATNVRLRLLRTKNLLGHLMSVARQDPTVTRRYFYSIKDISIGGRCMCNGHAESCDIQDPNDPGVLLCRCQHNTCGAKCNTCCPGFEQKKWQISKHNQPFACEPCNCFQHSNECVYDEEVDHKKLSLDIYGRYAGGGVCKNCQHNTEGINCNKCKPTFYRPYAKHWNETDVCRPCQCNYFYSTGNCADGSGECECRKEFEAPRCDSCSFGYYGYPDCRPCTCFLNGTRDLQCEAINGQCPCLYNFGGQYCNECANGFYNFPNCSQCECNREGSISQTCNQETGNCTCKNNFRGKNCDTCQDGYFNYPTCEYCNCDIKGTQDGICDKDNGKCMCKEGYGGERCDICLMGYYGYPDCKPCNCSKVGSVVTTCDARGKCSCLDNYAGKTCEQCSPGYYKYPDCLPCQCDSQGSNGVSCDGEGVCECHNNFAGVRCDACKEGFYNFPACEDCNCHPAGVVAAFAGCGSVPAGELCRCKDRVEGRICDKCRPLFWNLNANNPQGCEECSCNIPGVLGGIAVCDRDDGQCVCKNLVIARGCTECIDGTFNLQEGNLFGCSDCDCDIGGAVNNICDKMSGQCECHSRVTGRRCNEPLQAHYFPNIYQYQYEVEDGRTPSNTLVRHAYDENVFPNYSWKGYAIFSVLQTKVIQDIYIQKQSSLYRMVFRYVNNNPEPVIGTIRVIPESSSDNEQEFQVLFKNSSTPAFVTVSGAAGIIPSPFVMNPGRWQVEIEIKKDVLLDYFVLLPEEFYLATILNHKVEKPCTLNESDSLCRDYTYLNVTQYPVTFGVGGYVETKKKNEKLREFFQDIEHLSKINVGNRVPLINPVQTDISFNITVNQPGEYVLVINYVVPLYDQRTHKLNATVTSGKRTQPAKALLYACPYTTLCRQVLTSPNGIVFVQLVNGNEIKVDLKGINANVGIHSIVAIPYSEWSLDYIKPKSVCVRKDGTCIQSTFRMPPETKKIQFEEGNSEDAITLANSTYIRLDKQFNTLDLKGKVPSPGYYTFIVHYHQPNYQQFEVTVILQNGQFYEANIPVYYCPSQSGCRSIVKQPDGNHRFSLTENFMMTLNTKSKTKDVYLDYLLIIPADFHSDRYLEEENVDRASEFTSTCGNNNFNIDTSKEGFCKDSVYSITTAYNGGALPCQCDYDGSLSFECDKYGGQCQCKPNIIGRRCEACKIGYYGFPDCKPCNCPSTAYCEPSSGQCLCPLHVVGERCDQCEPRTYGFDPFIGCEPCNCNPLGVEGNNLQCNLYNGSCPCKANVINRQCDSCKPGHFLFPYCDYCDCNLAGTTDAICDTTTAACYCKNNVVGMRCERCKEGTFNLQAHNMDGCSECFCFGKTSRCTSSRLVQVSITQMEDWHIVILNTTTSTLEISPSNLTADKLEPETIGTTFSAAPVNNTYYFSAPHDYLGKKLTSYGGVFNYTIFYEIGENGAAVNGPDLILEGRKIHLTHFSFEQPPPDMEFSASIQFVESNFELPSGLPAKRDHLMEVLEDLKAIYVRATYWTVTRNSRLLNVYQSDAIEFQYQGDIHHNINFASSVEQCLCPPNYQGLSCEECAPGYYRVENGPHGGYCVPCQCHGHAFECDVKTGVCLNCTHNTRGDHCEMCDIGYHGNALAGTPNDCLICACPLPIASNNFATGCDVTADGEKIQCDCKHGYMGGRCHSCASGFYGKPEAIGDYCKPCQCSNNINPEDPTSCDTVSGECLRCLNNTFGKACALCAPGYYGDAVTLKNCQSCICDEMGTDHCNSFTGECVCKPNVIGEKCDRCELEHYGFQSRRGCTLCNCAEASDSNQCDDVTGQCKCKDGVTGRTCDRCSAGYWNYTADGCVSCGCKIEYSLGFGCNAQTGLCECLQGVVGDKCDQCPHRWVFVPEQGCRQCDSCTHDLLDTVEELGKLIDPTIFEFDSANSGYFTRRKLENMREQLNILEPKFAEVDPKQTNLMPRITKLEMLEQQAKTLHRQANYSLENSDSLKNNSEALKELAEELLDDIILAEDETIRVIEGINVITFELNKEEGPELDAAVKEGQFLLDEIKLLNLAGRQADAENELTKVDELLEHVNDVKKPADLLTEKSEGIKNELKDFNNKLDDLFNQTQYSLNKALEAQKIIDKSGKDRLKKKLMDIENQALESKNNLDVSEELNNKANKETWQAADFLDKLRPLSEEIEVHNNEFKTTIDNNEQGLIDIQALKPKAELHAKNLTSRAMALDNLLTETRDISESAVKAATAYKNIVDAVQDAKNASEQANNDADDAIELLKGIESKTFIAEQNSVDNLAGAHELYQSTNDDLKNRLKEAEHNYQPVQETHDKNDQKLNDINKILQNIQSGSLDNAYKIATQHAEDASQHLTNIDNDAKETFEDLPSEREKAKTLPKNVDDMGRNLMQTQIQLDTINEKLPSVLEAMDELPEKQERLQRASKNIENSINKLNQQIALARDIANQIKVGMRFYPNTTLELRNPPNLEDMSTSTRITGYFKTAKPDGLVWYLGNPVGTNLRRTKSDDYMALVILNGYPVLKLDIGNGPEQLINEKYVADDVWYQFIIDRTGHNAKLSIREELPDHTEHITTKEASLEGPYSIFNLDRNKSKLSIGSLPNGYEIQKEIDKNSFDGEIEELVVGDTPVSLWNFDNGYENTHGAKERNKLVNLVPSTGFRFNGNGYVILDARSYTFRLRSEVQMNFKTFATEGLLFLAGKGKTFMALELRNGKLLYQYNLGKETKLWRTRKMYNDGKWHTIKVSRDGPDGRFSVDDEEIADTTNPISGTSLEPIESISFGGYPNQHNYVEVSNTKFDGCIDHVIISGTPLDLRSNIRAYDVTPGCPDKFVRMVSFAKQKAGYLGQDDLFISNDFKINLKFKTDKANGLIFYATDKNKNNNISLALRRGHLVLISQKIELVSKDTFNDSEWHVVSAMHNDNELRIDFDDYGNRVTDLPPPPLHIMHGQFFVGDLPSHMKPIEKSTVGSTEPFSGCIGDLTLQGNVVNFANSSLKLNEVLGKCTMDEPVPGVHPEPNLPPIQPLEPITEAPQRTLPPIIEMTTDSHRGDGGFDEIVTQTTAPKVEETPPPVTEPTRRPYTAPPTTMKPHKEGCTLPLQPNETASTVVDDSFRFGTQKESRLEFSHLRGKIKKECDFTMEIKTNALNGVVIYMSDKDTHENYIALTLQNGYLTYSFGGKQGRVVITSRKQYNDDNWHYVEFSRKEGIGKLLVDGTDMSDGEAEHVTRLELKTPLYFGGLNPNHYNEAHNNLNTTDPFKGCMRNIKMNTRLLEQPVQIGIIPCDDNVEVGTYFPFSESHDGLVRLKEPRFKIGEVFNVKLEIKPRSDSGVILAAHGRKDFFILEMVNGVMKLTVDNGRGAISAQYTPTRYYLCDGKWHIVQAVKSKNVVTLSVDNIFTDPSIGDHHQMSADTASALFLGGHRFIHKARGIQSRQAFVGCIKNVYIDDEPIEIRLDMAENNVRVGYCPIN